MSSITTPRPTSSSPAAASSPVGLVFCCTLIGAAAQVLIKFGLAGAALSASPAVVFTILRNPWLVSGLALYGINTGLLILALRKGELSVLYPVIALTYVWVTILSVLVFKEAMNPFKIAGLATVVIGVTILGKKSPA